MATSYYIFRLPEKSSLKNHHQTHVGFKNSTYVGRILVSDKPLNPALPVFQH
ncbi:hypothetical protein QEO94_11545 [Kingella negevensis]|uniref:hypothetical protein n=1 Tax=Kingella negevensis TaxID=1522312 RepID=UPI002542D6DD|nr:hypothetical protein [Kingella negevensis]WII93230.1 hypothetical protein QEO94_11545 [Kingella negevensis]